MTANCPSGLVLEVAELVRNLQQQEVTDVDSVLGELTDSALKSMPDAQYAGVTIASREGKVRTVGATNRYPVLLDEIQQRNGGPCLSAAWEHHVIRINDMTLERRWPGFCRDTTEQSPIRSIMSFRLFTDYQNLSALNFYAEQSDAFDDEALELGLTLATHTALAWNMVRRDQQFRSALASRDIIGQAKGMLMERYDVDAVHAFELLKQLSQSSNTGLADLARKLVESKHP